MPPEAPPFANRDRTETVLAVSLSRADHDVLAALFERLPWKLTIAATLAEGIRYAMSERVRVVICEREWPGGNWQMLFDKIRELTHPPRLIVVSKVADESLWAEVLNLGGYDVLPTPFVADEVHRVVSYAVDSWHLQVQSSPQRGQPTAAKGATELR